MGPYKRGGTVYQIKSPQNTRRPEQEPDSDQDIQDTTEAQGPRRGSLIRGTGPQVQGQGFFEDLFKGGQGILRAGADAAGGILRDGAAAAGGILKDGAAAAGSLVPEINIEVPDINTNINTDLGIVNLRSNLRRPGTGNRSGAPRPVFEEVLKDVPEEAEEDDQAER